MQSNSVGRQAVCGSEEIILLHRPSEVFDFLASSNIARPFAALMR